jgi:hypothetical protein
MLFHVRSPFLTSSEHCQDTPDLLHVIDIMTGYLLHQVPDAHLPSLGMDAVASPLFLGELLKHVEVGFAQEAKEL